MNRIQMPLLSAGSANPNQAAKPANPRARFRPVALAIAVAAISQGVVAGPDGGVVTDGSANIIHNGNITDISQHSQNITVVWDNFDIDVNDVVNFLQPNSQSLALNRVLSADGTQINGQLNANGRVFVLDANGVLFGKNAKVNVGSLVASTLDLTHSNYSTDTFTFSGGDNPAAVTNLGKITAAETGAVALLGGRVSNYGVIQAKLGNIALAAGKQVTLDFAGDGLLNVQVDESALNALAENHGLIKADGGQVLMTAHASDALLQTVVNNTGVIDAHTLQEQDGKILLLGGMSDDTGGVVRVSGTLDTSAPESGDGGFIETSGSVVKVTASAALDTSSESGAAGTWLLDPTDLEISYDAMGANDGVSHVHTQALQNSLAGGNVILETADAGTGAGDITIAEPIIWASSNTLTLNADGGIAFNDYLHAPAGGLTLNALGNITTGAEGHINVGTFTLESGNFQQITAALPTFMADDFVISGGTFTRSAGGNGTSSPLILVDAYGLQGLATTPSFDATLAADIDLSVISNFLRIGDDTTAYTGTFDGAGHFIDNLTISVANQYETGLFGVVGAGGSVSNVGLYNASVTATGSADVGILVGRNEGSVSNSFTEGSVTADDSVGGLVGWNNGNGIVQTSYSTASVTALDGTNGRAGGLVGYNGGDALTTASWASGAVSGGGEMGGLIGYNQTNATVSNSYADIDTTGLSVVIGQNDGTSTDTVLVSGDGGVNPSAFQQVSYTQFDFSNDWFIAEDSSRPMLRAFLDGGNISNLYQLQGMAADLTASYTLLNDIDASATTSNNTADVWGGKGFAPVGGNSARFTGDFDGQGFVINQLAISRSSQDYVGLFGVTGVDAGLVNVRLQGTSIAGNNLAGGLVGYNDGGTITNSYITGSVVGRNQVGALVGYNSGDISSSYATATVDGSAEVGGLVGFNDNAEIINSYATGAVDGDSDVGGLVGYNDHHGEITSSYATGSTVGSSSTGGLVGNNTGSVTNSYWDTFTTGQATSDGGIAVNGDWDAAPNAYSEGSYTGFDFTNEWFIAEGYSRPMLRGHLSDAFTSGGEIHNVYDLQGMAADLSGSYTLMSDLDLAGIASGDTADIWGGLGFAPVGSYSDSFAGSFNGNGHVIRNLTINRGGADYVGLFGRTTAAASISNIGLENVAVSGDDNVGALVGWHWGDISNAYVDTGSVNAASAQAGGMVGGNSGSISNAYTNLTVAAVGGNAGGLVGLNDTGTITRSFALGSSSEGGLVGSNTGLIVDSFWNTDTTASGVGSGDASGATGLNSAELMDPASFAAWGADIDAVGGTGATWRIYEGKSAPLLGAFLAEIEVIAYDDYKVYDGAAYDGLHDINGTTGAGVRYGTSYAEFVSVFGEDGTPYSSDDINSADLEYAGDSQGAVDAGTYDITPSELWSNQTGYDIVVTDGVLTIDQSVVNVTVTINDASKEYGDADPTFSWRVTSGSLGAGDTLTGSLYRDPGENVGTYDIHGNITGDLASSNYIVTLNEGVFTITPRAITISIDDLSKVYGELDPELTYSVNGSAVDGDTLAVALTREAGENVGDYAITGEVSGDAAGDNYSVTFSHGLFTITPRAVTISISELEKIYGDDDPELTWAVTEGSLAPGETLQGSLSRSEGENVGSYAINGELSGAVASDNYAVTLNDGMLTINPRPIIISADDLAKIYGQQDPELTYTQTGNLAFDDTMTVALERAEGSDVGVYTITPTVSGDVQSDNYALQVANGALQITPAQLTVTAEDVETYWDLLPDEFPALIDGLTNGDTEQDVFGNSLTVETDLTLPIPGDYTLTPIATLASNNYTVSFVDGILTLLSSNPGTGYGDGLTSTQLPARESLGSQDRANIYEGRALLDGALDEISLGVMSGGTRMSEQELMDIGLPMPRAVLFAINSAEIEPMYADMLQAFVKKLEHYPDLTLLIEGHTSKTGPLWLNQRLARQRAMAVYNYLVELGIDPGRLGTKGFDWRHPIGDNSTLEGRALNRRAEITPDQPRNDGEQTNDQ